MLIGVPKEIKEQEFRVALTPLQVQTFVQQGHRVLVEKGAGKQVGFDDSDYRKAGAKIVSSAQAVYQAQMVIKVKEPQKSEYHLLKEGQILFSYLHLAPNPKLTKALIKSKCVAIAFETVTDEKQRLPLLHPMSEIAGRMTAHIGAYFLQSCQGGKGKLLGGVPGVLPAKVVVIGGGVVGTQALTMFLGLGADVTVLDNNLYRLRTLDTLFGSRLKTLYSSQGAIHDEVIKADLVVGAVLLPGKKAPKLITKQMVKEMEKGSLIIDVAIDQGGISETSKPTTHKKPTYTVDGVLHYCVSNMPAACAKTASFALANAIFLPALQIANKGLKNALLDDRGLREGLNICFGKTTNYAVANDLNLEYTPAEKALKRF